MTSITNRLKLLTPKVQTLLKTIPQNYCKLLLQREKQLQLPTSIQDTKLSATCKLSNKIKHATYRKFNLKQKKSSRKTRALQLNKTAAKKIKKTTHNQKSKHANPMRSSSSNG